MIPWRTGLTDSDAEIYIVPEGTKFLIIKRAGDLAAAQRTKQIAELLPDSVLVMIDDGVASVFVNHAADSQA